MPRYLSVDYYAVAQQDARAALSRLLLSVPAHLEQMGAYVYQGIAPSTLYRTPWIKSTQLKTVDIDIEEHLALLAAPYAESDKGDVVEKYESDTFYDPSGRCEIVPSSNPCSQESIDDEVLYKLGVLNSQEAGLEYFEKCKEEVTDQADMFVEELYGEGIHTKDGATPAVEKLLSRLQPLHMTDPFIDENGKPLQEESFLKHSRKWEGGEYSVNTVFDDSFYQPEIVLKEKLPNNEPDEFIEGTDVKQDELIVNTTSDIKELLAEAKAEELGGKLKDDLDSLTIKDEYKLSVEPLGCTVEEKDSPEPMDFLQMNEQSSQFKETEAMLESPILKERSQEEMTKPWIHETPINANEKADENLVILSQNSRMRTEKEMWIQGKYFDDVLALRLKEPECSVLVAVVLPPLEVLKQMNVKATIFDTKDLDLELQWDPFTEIMPKLKPECLKDYNVQEKHSSDLDDPLEKYAPQVYRPEIEGKKITCSAVLPTLYHPREIQLGGRERTPLQPDCRPKQYTQPSVKVTEKTPRKMAAHSPISVCTPAKFDDIQLFMSRRAARKHSNPKLLNAKIIDFPKVLSSHTKQTSSLSAVKDLNKEKEAENTVSSSPQKSMTTTSLSSPQKSKTTSSPKSPEKCSNELLDCTIAPSTPTLSKRSSATRKYSMVSVSLDTQHQDLLSKFLQLSQVYIHHLSSKRLLSPTQDFLSLTPDVTRFILKQHERKRQGVPHTIGCDPDYSAVIMLHTLVCCADMVTHCCIESATLQLASLKEKYGEHGDFSDAEQIFKDLREQGEQDKDIGPHPAMVKLCEHLSHWLVKKKLKSPGHDPKILIMMKQAVGCLCEAIAQVTTSVVSTEIFKPGTKPPSPQEVCAQLDKHTCLVIPAPLIDAAFPWSQFSIVVHYDFRDGQDTWKDICTRQNIRFLGVRIQAPEKEAFPYVNSAQSRSVGIQGGLKGGPRTYGGDLFTRSPGITDNIDGRSPRVTSNYEFDSISSGGNMGRSRMAGNYARRSPRVLGDLDNRSPRGMEKHDRSPSVTGKYTSSPASKECTKSSRVIDGFFSRSHTKSRSQSQSPSVRCTSNSAPGGLTRNPPRIISYTLMASEKVAEQSALLQELESKHQIFIDCRPRPYAPDICIDGKNCIMLVSLCNARANKLLRQTITRLSYLLLGFSTAWVLVHEDLASSPKSSTYVYSGDAVAIIAKIQASVANFNGMVGDSKAKVLLSGTASTTATMIRQIVDHIKPADCTILDPIKPQEGFMERLPCPNSINIHWMLERVPFTTLVTMSVQQMQQCFPDIPHSQLEVFWNLVNMNQGVGLDGTVQMDPLEMSEIDQDQSSLRDEERLSHQREFSHSLRDTERQEHHRGFTSRDTESERQHLAGEFAHAATHHATNSPISNEREDYVGVGHDLPDLALSQPCNEFAKAEMQGRLLNSFLEESELENEPLYSTTCDPLNTNINNPQRFNDYSPVLRGLEQVEPKAYPYERDDRSNRQSSRYQGNLHDNQDDWLSPIHPALNEGISYPKSMDRASGFNQRGKVYDQRQQGYEQRQQGFEQRQQGYEPRQQGYEPRQPGYQPRQRGNEQRGYEERRQRCEKNPQEFEPRQQVYQQRQQGYEQRQQGYDQRQQNFDQAQRPANTIYERKQQGRPNTSYPRPWAPGNPQRSSVDSQRLSMLSPESREERGAPCIAPITPTVRKQPGQLLTTSSPPMDLSSDESDAEQNVQQPKPSIARKLAEMEAKNRKKTEEGSVGKLFSNKPLSIPSAGKKWNQSNRGRIKIEPDYSQGRYGQPQNMSTGRPTNSAGSRQRINFRDSYNYNQHDMDTPHRYLYQEHDPRIDLVRSAGSSSGIQSSSSLTPLKKRKLTYAPVPGLKSGQTKLMFRIEH